MFAEQPLFWWLLGLTGVLAAALVLAQRDVRQWLEGTLARWRHRADSGAAPLVQAGVAANTPAPHSTGTAAASDGVATLTLIQGREILAVLRCPVNQVGEHTIGRSPVLCDQVVENNTVSRCHARLLWEPQSERWYIEDLGSKNGTYVNGEALQAYLPVLLRQGTRLILGGLELTVVTGSRRT
jgi:hypothetical protein